MDNKTKTTRILTVNATGKRYIVQRLELHSDDQAKNFAHTWGELVSYRGLSAKLDGSKKFRMDKVTVTEVARTAELLDELFHQNIEAKREAGQLITASRTGRTYTNQGTPLQRAKLADADYRYTQKDGFPQLQDAIQNIARHTGRPAPRHPIFTRSQHIENLWSFITEAERGGHDDQAEAILIIIEAWEV